MPRRKVRGFGESGRNAYSAVVHASAARKPVLVSFWCRSLMVVSTQSCSGTTGGDACANLGTVMLFSATSSPVVVCSVGIALLVLVSPIPYWHILSGVQGLLSVTWIGRLLWVRRWRNVLSMLRRTVEFSSRCNLAWRYLITRMRRLLVVKAWCWRSWICARAAYRQVLELTVRCQNWRVVRGRRRLRWRRGHRLVARSLRSVRIAHRLGCRLIVWLTLVRVCDVAVT